METVQIVLDKKLLDAPRIRQPVVPSGIALPWFVMLSANTYGD